MPNSQTVEVLSRTDGRERVLIIQRADRLFTYRKQWAEAGAWGAEGPDCGIYDSPEVAAAEARTRVWWLALRSGFTPRFGSCVVCHQGELEAWTDPSQEQVVLVCDDCESQWPDPDAAFSGTSALTAELQELRRASVEQMLNAGWELRPVPTAA